MIMVVTIYVFIVQLMALVITQILNYIKLFLKENLDSSLIFITTTAPFLFSFTKNKFNLQKIGYDFYIISGEMYCSYEEIHYGNQMNIEDKKIIKHYLSQPQLDFSDDFGVCDSLDFNEELESSSKEDISSSEEEITSSLEEIAIFFFIFFKIKKI